MKKLFSFFAVIAFLFTSGVLLSACNEKMEFAVHIPENLGNYGIDKIYTDEVQDEQYYISTAHPNIYFKFLPNYDYDADVLTITFKNNDDQYASLSALMLYKEDDNIKTYVTTVDRIEEINITIEGEAAYQTKNLQISTDLKELNVENGAKLMFNFTFGQKSTGDLTYAQFNAMMDGTYQGEAELKLDKNQALPYGTEVTVQVWNKTMPCVFDYVQFDLGDDLVDLIDCKYIIAQGDSDKLTIKNVYNFTLQEDRKLRIQIKDDEFTGATVGIYDASFASGVLHLDSEETDGITVSLYDNQGAEINTLAKLFEVDTVTIKIGKENVDAKLENAFKDLCEKVAQGQHNRFSINGEEYNATTTTDDGQQVLVFENVNIKYSVGDVLTQEQREGFGLDGLFVIDWLDMSQAMAG